MPTQDDHPPHLPPVELKRTRVEFATIRENFNEYELADGVRFKCKMVLVGIARVEGVSNPDGTPGYEPNFHPVFVLEKS